MCIVFFEWTEDRFLVCHNRDEFFSRPTNNTAWWKDDDTDGFEILAPRDARSGGTWFGFEKTTGRCAFLTNIREKDSTKYSTSRGEFVVNYLKSDKSLSAMEYLRQEFGNGDIPQEYAGFNLVVFSGRDMAYICNRYPEDEPNKGPIALSMGTAYGLSNSTLMEPYAKVRRGLEIFDQIVTNKPTTIQNNKNIAKDSDHLMEDLENLMLDSKYCPGDPLPRTGEPGFPESKVKARSSICVPNFEGYGTRTTIRFLLERKQTDDCQTDNQWQLRCIEKNWNTETLEWDESITLNCSFSLR